MSARADSMPGTARRDRRYLRWRLAIPPEKGGWVWWLGPLLVGALAAPRFTPEMLLVLLGGFAAFCLPQPLTLVTKHLRRGHGEMRPALVWAALHAAALAGVASMLLRAGHGQVVALGLLAAPVFAWRLALVYHRHDRRQRTLDLAAAGALALTGPAAYLAGGGEHLITAVWIWCLPALQSAASIVHMFLRLEQRVLDTAPPLAARLSGGLGPMLAHLLALGMALAALAAGQVSAAAVFALALPAAEGAHAILRPQVGHTPKQLGMRQLAISTVAMLLLALGLQGT